MRRIFLVGALTLLVFPIQALAAGQCVQQAIAERTGLPADQIQVTDSETPLFVSFEDALAVGDHIRFDIRVDGETFLTEDLDLIADEAASTPADAPSSGKDLSLGDGALAATPVVELLAAQPARLGVLRRLAEQRDVQVITSHNGVTRAGIPWIDLAAQSETLRAGGVEPHAIVSTLTITADTQPAQKDACTQQCDDEQYDCYLYRCGQFGSASCYNACDDQWLDCLEHCGICQPSSTTTTTYSIVSTVALNVFECRVDFPMFYGKGIYRAYDRTIKRTDTTTTTNSDCSQTVTTTVSYSHTYCFVFQYPSSGCYSVGTAFLC